MIHITGYGVIAEKARVGQLVRIFLAPCRKYYALDQKMNDSCLRSSYRMSFNCDIN